MLRGLATGAAQQFLPKARVTSTLTRRLFTRPTSSSSPAPVVLNAKRCASFRPFGQTASRFSKSSPSVLRYGVSFGPESFVKFLYSSPAHLVQFPLLLGATTAASIYGFKYFSEARLKQQERFNSPITDAVMTMLEQAPFYKDLVGIDPITGQLNIPTIVRISGSLPTAGHQPISSSLVADDRVHEFTIHLARPDNREIKLTAGIKSYASEFYDARGVFNPYGVDKKDSYARVIYPSILTKINTASKRLGLDLFPETSLDFSPLKHHVRPDSLVPVFHIVSVHASDPSTSVAYAIRFPIDKADPWAAYQASAFHHYTSNLPASERDAVIKRLRLKLDVTKTSTDIIADNANKASQRALELYQLIQHHEKHVQPSSEFNHISIDKYKEEYQQIIEHLRYFNNANMIYESGLATATYDADKCLAHGIRHRPEAGVGMDLLHRWTKMIFPQLNIPSNTSHTVEFEPIYSFPVDIPPFTPGLDPHYKINPAAFKFPLVSSLHALSSGQQYIASPGLAIAPLGKVSSQSPTLIAHNLDTYYNNLQLHYHSNVSYLRRVVDDKYLPLLNTSTNGRLKHSTASNDVFDRYDNRKQDATALHQQAEIEQQILLKQQYEEELAALPTLSIEPLFPPNSITRHARPSTIDIERALEKVKDLEAQLATLTIAVTKTLPDPTPQQKRLIESHHASGNPISLLTGLPAFDVPVNERLVISRGVSMADSIMVPTNALFSVDHGNEIRPVPSHTRDFSVAKRPSSIPISELPCGQWYPIYNSLDFEPVIRAIDDYTERVGSVPGIATVETIVHPNLDTQKHEQEKLIQANREGTVPVEFLTTQPTLVEIGSRTNENHLLAHTLGTERIKTILQHAMKLPQIHAIASTMDKISVNNVTNTILQPTTTYPTLESLRTYLATQIQSLSQSQQDLLHTTTPTTDTAPDPQTENAVIEPKPQRLANQAQTMAFQMQLFQALLDLSDDQLYDLDNTQITAGSGDDLNAAIKSPSGRITIPQQQHHMPYPLVDLIPEVLPIRIARRYRQLAKYLQDSYPHYYRSLQHGEEKTTTRTLFNTHLVPSSIYYPVSADITLKHIDLVAVEANLRQLAFSYLRNYYGQSVDPTWNALPLGLSWLLVNQRSSIKDWFRQDIELPIFQSSREASDEPVPPSPPQIPQPGAAAMDNDILFHHNDFYVVRDGTIWYRSSPVGHILNTFGRLFNGTPDQKDAIRGTIDPVYVDPGYDMYVPVKKNRLFTLEESPSLRRVAPVALLYTAYVASTLVPFAAISHTLKHTPAVFNRTGALNIPLFFNPFQMFRRVTGGNRLFSVYYFPPWLAPRKSSRLGEVFNYAGFKPRSGLPRVDLQLAFDKETKSWNVINSSIKMKNQPIVEFDMPITQFYMGSPFLPKITYRSAYELLQRQAKLGLTPPPPPSLTVTAEKAKSPYLEAISQTFDSTRFAVNPYTKKSSSLLSRVFRSKPGSGSGSNPKNNQTGGHQHEATIVESRSSTGKKKKNATTTGNAASAAQNTEPDGGDKRTGGGSAALMLLMATSPLDDDYHDIPSAHMATYHASAHANEKYDI